MYCNTYTQNDTHLYIHTQTYTHEEYQHIYQTNACTYYIYIQQFVLLFYWFVKWIFHQQNNNKKTFFVWPLLFQQNEAKNTNLKNIINNFSSRQKINCNSYQKKKHLKNQMLSSKQLYIADIIKLIDFFSFWYLSALNVRTLLQIYNNIHIHIHLRQKRESHLNQTFITYIYTHTPTHTQQQHFYTLINIIRNQKRRENPSSWYISDTVWDKRNRLFSFSLCLSVPLFLFYLYMGFNTVCASARTNATQI